MKYYYRAADYRAIGRGALSGNWPMAVLVGLVASLLGGVSSFTSTLSTSSNTNSTFTVHYGSNNYIVSWPVTAFLASIAVFITVYALAIFIFGSAIELGYNNYNIRLVQRVPQSPFATLFEKMNQFGRALWLRIVMHFFIFLWTLLFIIPGIVAAYRYSMAPYLMAQNPNLTAMQAIEQSKQIMKGNKGRLFCLELSFIGWIFLAVLSCGIGILFLTPYLYATRAAFYLDMTNQLPQPGMPYAANAPMDGTPYGGGQPPQM